MSLTTSTFLLKTIDESQFTGTGRTFPITISATNNKLSLGKPLENNFKTYDITIQINTYNNISDLVNAIQTGFNTANAPFTAFAAGSSVGIKTTGTTFFINASPTNGANAILGFPTTRVGSGNLYFYRSYTFPPIEFYPPSTISDTNVFMQLVNAEMFGNSLESTRIPFVVSLKGLPQPVGTYSDAEQGCRPSTFLGHVCTRGHGERGPRILTHIPDGVQQLTFQIDQLYQADRDFRISANQVFSITIEFEVSTSK
jgi:hypothetical protein